MCSLRHTLTIAPGLHRNLVSLFAHMVENGQLSLIGVGFVIKKLVEVGLHCIVSVLSTVPIATLDHFREGENLRCILPLPQPASLFVAKVVLCNLVQHVYHVEHVWTEAGQFSEWLIVTGINFMYLIECWHEHAENENAAFPSSTADKR